MKVGPQPAHAALGLFCRALGVELHQVGQDVVGAGRGGQAVGRQHGGVQLVVQLAQHAHQALGVLGFLFGGERAAFAQGGQHVVEAGEGEAGVAGFGCQHALAVGVDLFGELGDAVAQGGSQAGVFVGEGESAKADGAVVDRTVLKSAPCRQRPLHM